MAQASGKPYSETDAHVIRRLESFSDIVIGFSLAEATLNLVVPKHPFDIFSNPSGLIAYLFTFWLIALVWWSHSQLFQHYFLPNRLTYFLCFITLALTGLLVYAFQVWMHTGDTSDSYSAAQIYFGTLALTYCVLGSLYLIGLKGYRALLEPVVRAKGYIRSAWFLGMGLGAGVGTTISAIPGWSIDAKHQAHLFLGVDRGPVPAEAVFGLMLGGLVALSFTAVARSRMRRLRAEARQ